MGTLSKRERTMIIGCVLFLIVVGFLVLLPSGKQGGEQKLLSKSQADSQYRMNAAKYVKLGHDQDDLAAQVEKLAYDQPAENLVPQLVKNLQQIAMRSGVHLREVQPLRPRKLPSGQGVRVPVEVHFRATFQPDVVRFLYEVEDPAGKMVVDKVDISSVDSQFKTVEVAAQITVFSQSVSGVTNLGEGESSDVSVSTGQG